MCPSQLNQPRFMCVLAAALVASCQSIYETSPVPTSVRTETQEIVSSVAESTGCGLSLSAIDSYRYRGRTRYRIYVSQQSNCPNALAELSALGEPKGFTFGTSYTFVPKDGSPNIPKEPATYDLLKDIE